MNKLKLAEDYWDFYKAHYTQPCRQCARQHLKEMRHWSEEGLSDGKYAFLRARILDVLKNASPIDKERLCIEHILKQEDVYKLRYWFYNDNLEPYSDLVEIAFLDQLKIIWNKANPCNHP